MSATEKQTNATADNGTATRKFVAISPDLLRKKIVEEWDGSIENMIAAMRTEIGVTFDTENFCDTPDYYHDDEMSGLLGFEQLASGLSVYGCMAGGDWEYPVYFFIYWDGTNLRAYTPTNGNPWNRATKAAYGNDFDSDARDVFSRWPTKFQDLDEVLDVDDIVSKLESDHATILNEINRVFVRVEV